MFMSGEIIFAFLVGFLISYKAKLELDKLIEEDARQSVLAHSNS